MAKKNMKKLPAILLIAAILLWDQKIFAVGTWGPLDSLLPPNVYVSHMMLLSDGSVIAQGLGGLGTNWYRLYPDQYGNYVHGLWFSNVAPMNETRQYYASDVLPDGRVFVAGGEYGYTLGGQHAEIYDPYYNVWTQIPIPNGLVQTNLAGDGHSMGFADAPSIVMPDGRVLIIPIYPGVGVQSLVYNPADNSWIIGPNPKGNQNEASWVKLPDDSILTLDRDTVNAERFIPSLSTWIPDQPAPASLYSTNSEIGAGLLTANGKVVYFGGTGHTCIYTPSGNTNYGSWVQGPDIPQGLVMRDAPAAMLVNGNILCAFTTAVNDVTNYYYEFNPNTLTFAQAGSPRGGLTNTAAISDATSMLVLPDGSVLYSDAASRQLFVYTIDPATTPLASGKPVISSLQWNGDITITAHGSKFNGFSQGAVFGDDLQMDENYPLAKFTSGSGLVYFGRSFNWSSTGVQTGNNPVTTRIAPPDPVLFNAQTFSLQIVANGIASDPVSVAGPMWVDVNYAGVTQNGSFSYPYKTFAQGINAAPTFGAVILKPGTSHETITISKAMTITSYGGTAIIGQ